MPPPRKRATRQESTGSLTGSHFADRVEKVEFDIDISGEKSKSEKQKDKVCFCFL